MIQIKDIKLPIGHDNNALLKKIKKTIDYNNTCRNCKNFEYEIIKKSIDARKKPDIYYIYSILLSVDSNTENNIKRFVNKKKINNLSFETPVKYKLPCAGNILLKNRPVIIGSGPAGLFAAYILAQKGYKPIVIERGQAVDDRSKTVEKSFDTGIIDTESNVQFGEGGAGTFSDGKLNTLTKDPSGRNAYVFETFHNFGAPKEITYYAKPHIGTDLLKNVIKNMRKYICENGGDFFFNTKLTDICIEDNQLKNITVFDREEMKSYSIDTDVLLLCIGHSARDTFEMLYHKNIKMEAKNFAVGFRVSHKQTLVDRWQYGVDDAHTIGLEAADYKVTNETSNGRRVYSFCMCPGGYVVNSSSEKGQMCVNGMSESKRDSGYANSAIICAVTPDDYIQDCVDNDHPLKGMYYQRRIEREAFVRAGSNGNICGQYFKDYEKNITSEELDKNDICIKGKVSPGNLRGIFAEDIDKAIIESIHKFGYTREAFDGNDTIMYGVEARTSSPVRIVRNDEYLSNIGGIYPVGEGAGYAGGITSAATDGIKVAEAIVTKYRMDY